MADCHLVSTTDKLSRNGGNLMVLDQFTAFDGTPVI